MHTYDNAYSYMTPKELHTRALLGKSAINIILFISLISTMGYWYVLGLQASTATGFWAVLAFSIIGIGLVTELVKKITLSLFRHKAIWLGATVVSVITIMGTLSIIDNNKELGLIRSSDEYQLAQHRQEDSLNSASSYAWAQGFDLNKLNNDLTAVTAKRERREIGYQAYLAEKRAINEKITAKRNYDSAMNMQTVAGGIMANGANKTTSSNPLLYNVAMATGVGAVVLKTVFYLAVTLLLEFSAWFLGGEVQKISNQLNMTREQLLDLEVKGVFGFSPINMKQTINRPALGSDIDIKNTYTVFLNGHEKATKKAVSAGQIIEQVLAFLEAKNLLADNAGVEIKAVNQNDSKDVQTHVIKSPTLNAIKPQKNKDPSYKTPLNEDKKAIKTFSKSTTRQEKDPSYKVSQERAENSADQERKQGDKKAMITRLKLAKSAGVGSIIECVNCGKEIEKKSHTQKFCSHSRKPRADGGNCSNDYTVKMKT